MNARLFALVTILICLMLITLYKRRNYDGIYTQGLDILNYTKSPYQSICLARDKDTNHVCMILNGVIQNHTKEYKRSHYAMVDIPIKLLNKKPNNILILGGGDGYPAMRALKQKNAYIKNVEIDHTLIDFVRTNNIMRKLTQDSFNNPRLDLTAMDAYKYIYNENRKFDLIVHDIELKTNNTITEFGSHDDYIIENLLNDDGILNYTQDLYGDIPEFENIYKKYKRFKRNSSKKHVIALLQTKEEFDVFNKSSLFDVSRLKERYPNSEIGMVIYDLKCSCGVYQYREELYFYISKQPFNRLNQDIEFIPFINLV